VDTQPLHNREVILGEPLPGVTLGPLREDILGDNQGVTLEDNPPEDTQPQLHHQVDILEEHLLRLLEGMVVDLEAQVEDK